jgi:hypothetical protein
MIPALDTDSNLPSSSIPSAGKLSADARARLDAALNVRRYVDRLLSDGLEADAIDVLVHVLPKRYAIAWGLECLQQAGLGDPAADPVDRSAMAAAQRWLSDPTDENRRAAADIADRLRYETPGAWLAAAAGWSGGSLLPPAQPEVKPETSLTGDAVSASLKLAAAATPAEYPSRLQAFVRRALDTFSTPSKSVE